MKYRIVYLLVMISIFNHALASSEKSEPTKNQASKDQALQALCDQLKNLPENPSTAQQAQQRIALLKKKKDILDKHRSNTSSLKKDLDEAQKKLIQLNIKEAKSKNKEAQSQKDEKEMHELVETFDQVSLTEATSDETTKSLQTSAQETTKSPQASAQADASSEYSNSSVWRCIIN